MDAIRGYLAPYTELIMNKLRLINKKNTINLVVTVAMNVFLFVILPIATLGLIQFSKPLFFIGTVLGFTFPKKSKEVMQRIFNVWIALETFPKRVVFGGFCGGVTLILMPAVLTTANLFASSQIGGQFGDWADSKAKKNHPPQKPPDDFTL